MAIYHFCVPTSAKLDFFLKNMQCNDVFTLNVYAVVLAYF